MLSHFFRPVKVALCSILLVTFTLYQQGCAVYNTETKTTLSHKDVTQGKRLFLADDSGRRSEFRLNELTAESLNLSLVHYEFSTSNQTPNPPTPASGEEVVIYLNPGEKLSTEINQILPLSRLSKVEVKDLSTGKTIFTTLLAAMGIGILVFAILVVIILATKDSCPFLYAWDGQGFDFKGELYSGSVYPFLERHDYLPIGTPISSDGKYRLRLRNEIKEIQHTNILDLVIVDHAPDKILRIDKYGKIHQVAQWTPAAGAKTFLGQDVDSLLNRADGQGYVGQFLEYRKPHDLDHIIMSFPKPAGEQKATLGIRAKNTFWLDYAYGQMLELFGESLPAWNRHIAKDDPAKHIQWAQEQGMYLRVYVEEQGQFVYRDHFNLIGPMAYKDDALGLDLSGISGDSVRIKLEFGPQFWDIDQVGMAFETNHELQAVPLPLVSATDEKGVDRLPQLRADDTAYYVQPEIGNEAELIFEAPTLPTGMARTAFVHSKGHYEILRDTRGKPLRIASLMEIKKPGGFVAFTRDLMRQHVEAGQGTAVSSR